MQCDYLQMLNSSDMSDLMYRNMHCNNIKATFFAPNIEEFNIILSPLVLMDAGLVF